jgi:hypothetical protein
MSRQLLRRLLAIVAAYGLALQPIASAPVVHDWDGAARLCSRAGDDTAPPSEREHEHACCLGTCCPGLFGPVAMSAAALQSRAAVPQFPLLAAQVFAMPKARYPQSRAPPAWPA